MVRGPDPFPDLGLPGTRSCAEIVTGPWRISVIVSLSPNLFIICQNRFELLDLGAHNTIYKITAQKTKTIRARCLEVRWRVISWGSGGPTLLPSPRPQTRSQPLKSPTSLLRWRPPHPRRTSTCNGRQCRSTNSPRQSNTSP